MRRRRPLGLTLALLACTVLYGLFPLAEGAFFLILKLRTGDPVSFRVVLILVLGVVFMLLLIPAWLGRPPQIRLILMGAVLVLMVINLAFTLGDMTAASGEVIADSLSQTSSTLNTCSLLSQVLIPLYVIWYLARYPSRTYYAGGEEQPQP